jgi:imidazolonepropionase-like amidohydrolase
MNASRFRRAPRILITSLLSIAALGALALAQPVATSPLSPPSNGPRHADPSYHVLYNATIHVSPDKTIDHGMLVIRDGKIESVISSPGPDGRGGGAAAGGGNLPAGARAWDCNGLHLYPGFIDPYVEVDAPRPDASEPGTHWNTRVTPQRSALDGNGIDDKTSESLRKLGFAAAAIAPKGGIFRGSAAAVSLAKPAERRSGDRPPIYLDRVYQSMAFDLTPIIPAPADAPGDSPAPRRRRGGGGDEDVSRWPNYPDSEMGAIALMRQTLIDADWTAASRAAGATLEPSCLDSLCVTPQARSAGFTGQLLINADDELEVLRAAKIAAEFDRPLAILGCGTEFRRLDAISRVAKAQKVPLILPLNFTKTPDVSSVGKAEAVELREMMTWEQAPTNPRRLDAAGVTLALTTAKLKDRAQFRENLTKALRHGLDPAHALAMLTTNPALVLGVSDRLGTLEKGKIANIIVADADLFAPWPKKDQAKKSEPVSSPAPGGGGGGAAAGGGHAAASSESPKPSDAAPERASGEQPKPTDAKSAEAKLEGPKTDDDKAPDDKKDVKSDDAAKDDAKKDDKSKPKIRDLWIDGVRHEINAAPSKDALGTWAVTEIDGKVVDPQAPDAVTFVVSEDSITYLRSGKRTKCKAVHIDGPRISYTIEAKELFDIDATLVDSGVATGDTMLGITPMPSGKLHRWTAIRTSASTELPPEKKAETRRRERNPDSPVPAGGGGGKAAGGGDNPASPPEAQAEAPGKDAPSSLETSKPTVDADAHSSSPAPSGGGGGEAAGGGRARDKKTPAKSPEDREREAIAAIPDKYGYPFGPYMLDDQPVQPDLLIITNATIWTSNAKDEILENATLIVRKGKIDAVLSGSGAAGVLPALLESPGAVVVDAKGKHVTPGVIDCHSHTGISRGVNEAGRAVSAEVRIADVTDPDSISWYRQLASGVTAVNSLHGSANAIGGQNQVNKLRWGAIAPDDMHFEGAMPGIKFALGENPRQANSGSFGTARYPQTRMGVEGLIRDRFTAAREYAAQHASAGKGPTESAPAHRNLELEALAEVLDAKRLVHCHSYRQDELLMLCRVADDFHFKIGTFQHVLEGYKVADEIASHSRGGSCFSDWWAYKIEVQDAIPQNGPIMREQGVVVSFNSDSDELARRLNSEAGKAIKYGHVDDGTPAGKDVSPAQALKFVTLNPAIQLAIESRVGSLEHGKDADFAIWSGPPLSPTSRCEATYIDGRRYFSLEDDAKHRERIAKERGRLVQKILASASDRPSRGDSEAGGAPRGRPTEASDESSRRESLLERMYMDALNRGRDPNSAEPGDCGCNTLSR